MAATVLRGHVYGKSAPVGKGLDAWTSVGRRRSSTSPTLNLISSMGFLVCQWTSRPNLQQGSQCQMIFFNSLEWYRELPSSVLGYPKQNRWCTATLKKSAASSQEGYLPLKYQYWAINLMADVLEHEFYNKMDARNIAMVFAPNMTQVGNIRLMSFKIIIILHYVENLENYMMNNHYTCLSTDG